MELYYAVKPLSIIQGFGENPAYYARFLDAAGNPEKGHVGIDFVAAHATPLYAPVSGDAYYLSDVHGGDGIHIRTPNNGDPAFEIILWHLCSKDDPKYHPVIPCDGSMTPVKLGDLIGYTDNTGAPFESSGDHLHFGLMPCDKTGEPLHPYNGFGGCIDPAPYFNGKFAQDVPLEEQIVTKASQVVQLVAESDLPHEDKLAVWQKVEEFLKSLL